MSLTYASSLSPTPRAVLGFCSLAFAAFFATSGCASKSASESDGADGSVDDTPTPGPLPTTTRDAAAASGATGKSVDGGVSSAPPVVSGDAVVCQVDLTFKPEGCACTGDPVACWTGPANKRNVGKCHDGMQACKLVGEFSSWGACAGEEHDCGDVEVPDAGTPDEDCSCVPGVTIACDEDCTTLVICSTTGKKTCQPDGTFSPCREELLHGGLPDVLGCRSAFFGCLPGSDDGAYSGDCSAAFVCGHAPNSPL